MLLHWVLANPERQPPGIETELADLRAKLSPELGRWLESKPEEEQWQVITAWIRFSGALRIAFWGGSPAASMMTEELAKFLEQEVSEVERDGLLSMPAQEMERRLRWMYLRAKLPDLAFLFPDHPGGRQRPGGGQFGPPGGGRRGGPPGSARGRPPGRPGPGSGRFGEDRSGQPQRPDENRNGPPRGPQSDRNGPADPDPDAKGTPAPDLGT